jgi:hypothetical protein
MHKATTTTDKRGTLAELISVQQAVQQIDDQQLSSDLGFSTVAILMMIKAGNMAFPLTKVPALAKTFCLDADHLLRLALQDTNPELLAVLDQVYDPMNLTVTERELIQSNRRASNPVAVSCSASALPTP